MIRLENVNFKHVLDQRYFYVRLNLANQLELYKIPNNEKKKNVFANISIRVFYYNNNY